MAFSFCYTECRGVHIFFWRAVKFSVMRYPQLVTVKGSHSLIMAPPLNVIPVGLIMQTSFPGQQGEPGNEATNVYSVISIKQTTHRQTTYNIVLVLWRPL